MKVKIYCKPCPGCKKTHRVEVEEQDFYRWQGSWDKPGVLIQEAFPYLTDGQREMLQTGFCEACWAVLVADVEEL